MSEKGFRGTSIQDITERANVNRSTFYAHFEDKYALLDELLREEFRRLVRAFPPFLNWELNTLHTLIRLVLENFRDVQRRCHPLGSIDPFVERVLREELADLLLRWLREKRGENAREIVPWTTLAQTMSWAILGAALQWSQEPGGRSSEQMARDVLLIITPGIERLAPNALKP
jgi:AcrR family transcriptional regulator